MNSENFTMIPKVYETLAREFLRKSVRGYKDVNLNEHLVTVRRNDIVYTKVHILDLGYIYDNSEERLFMSI